MLTGRFLSLTFFGALYALSQTAQLQPAGETHLPILSDSSSPAHWVGGTMYLFQSGELATPDSMRPPLRFQGTDQFHLAAQTDSVLPDAAMSIWIESTWLDSNGRLYAWYHREPSAGCPNAALRLPEIGALRSDDNGATFTDLGVILRSGAAADCSAGNGFFAGGNGDFSVLADKQGQYLYLLFTNYGGTPDQQGIAVARMAVADRDTPVGKVWKYSSGQWLEPGLGGQVSPIFVATANWSRADTDSYWGPSLHYNSYLDGYVALMNRSCCSPGFPQEGVYVTFNRDLGNPTGWSTPTRILAGSKQGYYPPEWYAQVLGTESGETDKLAGQTARFYLAGTSKYEIVFTRPIAPLVITTTGSLAGGVSGKSYATQLSATGGMPPYRWSITSGAFPGGLVLDPASGAIAGTLGASGAFAFVAQVADSAGAVASAAFTIVVTSAPPPLNISSAGTLTAGTAGIVYLSTLVATGGMPPYTWTLLSGAIPPGLQLTASGILSGTPSAAGNFAFTVQVADSAGNSARQAFTLPIVAVPTLASTSLLNAASYQTAVAPGSIVSIFGTTLAATAQSATATPLPIDMNGTSVTINGMAAPLFYVSATQINAQIPFETPPGQASLAVRYGSQTSASRTVLVAAFAPAIFTANQTGTGPGIILHGGDYSLVSSKAPAHAGEYLILYCTGLGALRTAEPTGGIPPTPPPLIAGQASVTIGGVSAQPSYAGAAPGFVGLYQVNVQVPIGVPAGDEIPLQLQVNGISSNVAGVAIR